MEKGFVAPGCIRTMRGEGVGGFQVKRPCRNQNRKIFRWQDAFGGAGSGETCLPNHIVRPV
jgi:hypothetical protein